MSSSKGRSAWGGIKQAASTLTRFLPRSKEPGQEALVRQVVPMVTGRHVCNASACAEPQAARDRVEGVAEGAGTALGYASSLNMCFEVGVELGRGGNAVVRVVKDRRTGHEFACKTLKKVLFLVSILFSYQPCIHPVSPRLCSRA